MVKQLSERQVRSVRSSAASKIAANEKVRMPVSDAKRHQHGSLLKEGDWATGRGRSKSRSPRTRSRSRSNSRARKLNISMSNEFEKKTTLKAIGAVKLIRQEETQTNNSTNTDTWEPNENDAGKANLKRTTASYSSLHFRSERLGLVSVSDSNPGKMSRGGDPPIARSDNPHGGEVNGRDVKKNEALTKNHQRHPKYRPSPCGKDKQKEAGPSSSALHGQACDVKETPVAKAAGTIGSFNKKEVSTSLMTPKRRGAHDQACDMKETPVAKTAGTIGSFNKKEVSTSLMDPKRHGASPKNPASSFKNSMTLSPKNAGSPKKVTRQTKHLIGPNGGPKKALPATHVPESQSSPTIRRLERKGKRYREVITVVSNASENDVVLCRPKAQSLALAMQKNGMIIDTDLANDAKGREETFGNSTKAISDSEPVSIEVAANATLEQRNAGNGKRVDTDNLLDFCGVTGHEVPVNSSVETKPDGSRNAKRSQGVCSIKEEMKVRKKSRTKQGPDSEEDIHMKILDQLSEQLRNIHIAVDESQMPTSTVSEKGTHESRWRNNMTMGPFSTSNKGRESAKFFQNLSTPRFASSAKAKALIFGSNVSPKWLTKRALANQDESAVAEDVIDLREAKAPAEKEDLSRNEQLEPTNAHSVQQTLRANVTADVPKAHPSPSKETKEKKAEDSLFSFPSVDSSENDLVKLFSFISSRFQDITERAVDGEPEKTTAETVLTPTTQETEIGLNKMEPVTQPIVVLQKRIPPQKDSMRPFHSGCPRLQNGEYVTESVGLPEKDKSLTKTKTKHVERIKLRQSDVIHITKLDTSEKNVLTPVEVGSDPNENECVPMESESSKAIPVDTQNVAWSPCRTAAMFGDNNTSHPMLDIITLLCGPDKKHHISTDDDKTLLWRGRERPSDDQSLREYSFCETSVDKKLKKLANETRPPVGNEQRMQRLQNALESGGDVGHTPLLPHLHPPTSNSNPLLPPLHPRTSNSLHPPNSNENRAKNRGFKLLALLSSKRLLPEAPDKALDKVVMTASLSSAGSDSIETIIRSVEDGKTTLGSTSSWSFSANKSHLRGEPTDGGLRSADDFSVSNGKFFNVRVTLGCLKGLTAKAIKPSSDASASPSLIVGFARVDDCTSLATPSTDIARSRTVDLVDVQGKSHPLPPIVWRSKSVLDKRRSRLYFSVVLKQHPSGEASSSFSKETVNLVLGLERGDETIPLGTVALEIDGTEVSCRRGDFQVQTEEVVPQKKTGFFKSRRRTLQNSFQGDSHVFRLEPDSTLSARIDIRAGAPDVPGSSEWDDYDAEDESSVHSLVEEEPNGDSVEVVPLAQGAAIITRNSNMDESGQDEIVSSNFSGPISRSSTSPNHENVPLLKRRGFLPKLFAGRQKRDPPEPRPRIPSAADATANDAVEGEEQPDFLGDEIVLSPISENPSNFSATFSDENDDNDGESSGGASSSLQKFNITGKAAEWMCRGARAVGFFTYSSEEEMPTQFSFSTKDDMQMQQPSDMSDSVVTEASDIVDGQLKFWIQTDSTSLGDGPSTTTNEDTCTLDASTFGSTRDTSTLDTTVGTGIE